MKIKTLILCMNAIALIGIGIAILLWFKGINDVAPLLAFLSGGISLSAAVFGVVYKMFFMKRARAEE